VCRTHKNAIYRTGLNAQSTKHALCVINCKSRNFESLRTFDPLLTDVDAVDGARFGALITGDARRQIVTMKATITRSNGNRLLGVLELIGKRAAICFIRDQPIAQCHPHSMADRIDRNNDISKPIQHQTRPRKFAAWKPVLNYRERTQLRKRRSHVSTNAFDASPPIMTVVECNNSGVVGGRSEHAWTPSLKLRLNREVVDAN
jgi:hypothetical protein